MMGIPPSAQPPEGAGRGGRSEESYGPEEEEMRQDFRLPERRQPKEGKKRSRGKEEENKKKGLFDLTKKEKKGKEGEGIQGVQEKLSREEESSKEMQIKAEEAASIAAKEGTTKISQLIQKMVEKLQVGTVGGKDFASVDLKGGADVPDFFANSTLMLTQTGRGLVIQFTNFDTPQQQQAAIKAVEQNKEQLSQMMLNLQAKNITVAQLQIGNHQIALPRAEGAVPLQPPPSAEEARQERERGREGGEEGGRGREEGGPSE